MGFHIKQYHLFEDVDYITSVPLHKDKERKRGYNQSSVIGEGLKWSATNSIRQNAARRKKIFKRKQRNRVLQRWDNVKDIFRNPGSR